MNEPLDLLVIGGGASGASVTYEAARRGLSVALLEGSDLSCGTSCRSTKLLHGGVRYLELAFKTADPAQLRLVREALLERGHWLRQAPFLAQRLELALPTKGLIGQLYYRMGLGVYDALAGQTGIGSSRWLSKTQLHQALPQIKPGLNGGVAYSDGQFDDARLNLLLALTAEQAGAQIHPGCRVTSLTKDGSGRINGAISMNADGQEQRWTARVVVNATGIQADSIRQMADPDVPDRMLTSRGVHLVLRANLCPAGVGLLLPSTDDGRVLFMLPFFGRTLVGTTDTACSLTAAATPSQDERDYLLAYVRRWFPQLSDMDVGSCWAGGRPLLKPAGAERNSSRVVREHEVETLPCGLVSVMGGKWTTCRPMALETLEAVAAQLGRPLPSPKPLPLLGAANTPEQTSDQLQRQQQELHTLLPATPQRGAQIRHLQGNFGVRAATLVSRWTADERVPVSDVIPICRGELRHAVKAEHARSVTAVLARRCRLAMVDQGDAERLVPLVNDLLEEHQDTTPAGADQLNLAL